MGDVLRFFRRYMYACIVGAVALILGTLGFAEQVEAIATDFEPWAFQALGAALFVTFVVMVLMSFDKTTSALSARPIQIDLAEQERREHRRKVIADGRRLVAAFNQQARQPTLTVFVQYQQEWPSIRALLSPAVRDKIENGRLAVSSKSGEKDGKIHYLMDELDRLEREWDLA